MIIKVRGILPRDLDWQEDIEIEVPAWAFMPDAWSFAFLRGLRMIAPTLTGFKIWEVGVGAGLNLLCLAQWSKPECIYFSDLNSRCTDLAESNLGHRTDKERFIALSGQWDLTSNGDQSAPLVDIIAACIPQVPAKINLDEGDNLAHYYDADRYVEASLHAVGLGLNEAMLCRATSVLNAHGRIVLNLGGRPGLARLKKMFRACGYAPRVIHAELIPQCPSTSLSSLAEMEKHGQEFEFFSDANGHNRINAQTAEQRRVKKLELYHKIYVIEGKLIT